MNAPLPEPPAVRPTCPYCGVGCGLLARPDGYGGAEITGDPDHPANFGRICSKGAALGETLSLTERLLYPMLRQGDGRLGRVDWHVALDRVAAGLERILARHGPDAIAFYLSRQLLTEDYYVAHKLMKGFLGSPHLHTHLPPFMASPDVAATAKLTRLSRADVARFFDLFRDTPHTVTCFSQGVNQSAQGTDKVNAIINCHLATGRLGRRGQGPFSLTGQPNAMGGREVGGLANQLAAHMTFTPEDVDRVRRFWNAPRMAAREGAKAVAMFDAIARGRIKALWVMATNPAVSLPRANYVREALTQLDLFVVSENVLANDTVNAGAHVLLPAAAWGEKDGTVTNSERRISRQRQFLPLPGEAKPDWWIVTQVARRMGFSSALRYSSASDIFREHAALSAFENGGRRDFDLSALAAISERAFDQLDPVQWPLRAGETPQMDSRFFMQGDFYTPDRKARFIAVEPPAPKVATSRQFPFRLNTGRVRDQWHTMTRSGQSARLATHRPEPFVDIHPADAKAMKLSDGCFANVTTRFGSCVLKVAITEEQRRGSLFTPIHWSDATASAARINDLVMPETDRYSGQPDAKATPASIAPVEFAFRGFALARRPISAPHGACWTRVAVAGASGLLLATNDGPEIWQTRPRPMLS